jgi:hypothetical protein
MANQNANNENCVNQNLSKEDFMTVYKYKAKVSKDGTIHLEVNPELSGKQVEVVLTSNESTLNTSSASAFVEEWAGFLSASEVNDPKPDYLKKKSSEKSTI